MKKFRWSILIVLVVIMLSIITLVGIGGTVLATVGADGLEVISLGIQSLLASQQVATDGVIEAQTHTMINIIAIIRMGLEEEP